MRSSSIFNSLGINKLKALFAAACCSLLLSGLLSGCGGYDPEKNKSTEEKRRDEVGSILDAFKDKNGNAKSDGGIFGQGLSFNGKSVLGGSAGGSSVNEDMWRAAYDVTSVLPIQSASRQRGTIETDWYAPPGITHEQMRVVVFVGGGPLNATGVKVNAFRRGFDAQGQVVQTPASATVSEELEKAILKRALDIANS